MGCGSPCFFGTTNERLEGNGERAVAIDANVFPNLYELRIDFDIDTANATELEASSANACEMCGVPPLRKEAAKLTAIQWFDRYDSDGARRMRDVALSTTTISGRSATDEEPARWQQVVSVASLDSFLQALLPVPVELMEFVRARLDEVTLAIVPSFIFAVCGKCSHATPASETIAPHLQRMYITRHFEGSHRAAIAQSSWVAAREFMKIVAEEARRLKPTG